MYINSSNLELLRWNCLKQKNNSKMKRNLEFPIKFDPKITPSTWWLADCVRTAFSCSSHNSSFERHFESSGVHTSIRKRVPKSYENCFQPRNAFSSFRAENEWPNTGKRSFNRFPNLLVFETLTNFKMDPMMFTECTLR